MEFSSIWCRKFTLKVKGRVQFWWCQYSIADPVYVLSEACALYTASRVRLPFGTWVFVVGVCMSCCPVQVEALRRADHSSQKVLPYVEKLIMKPKMEARAHIVLYSQWLWFVEYKSYFTRNSIVTFLLPNGAKTLVSILTVCYISACVQWNITVAECVGIGNAAVDLCLRQMNLKIKWGIQNCIYVHVQNMWTL
jgi:hypothetical protein